jgi:hypothetical protein
VEWHKAERHHACRAINHSARLQGDAKEVSEEAQVDSEEERHHINQEQVRSTEASLGCRQLPKFEAVNVNSNVCGVHDKASWSPWAEKRVPEEDLSQDANVASQRSFAF